MTREIVEHKVNPANDRIRVIANEAGHGGASHRYVFHGVDEGGAPHYSLGSLFFQNGPINEAGVNGITHEVLLAVVADRLRSFQTGAYACKENACALTKIEEAMHWLHARTLKRVQRGVEGTHAV